MEMPLIPQFVRIALTVAYERTPGIDSKKNLDGDASDCNGKGKRFVFGLLRYSLDWDDISGRFMDWNFRTASKQSKITHA